jgi:hypothetical protein
MALSKMPVDSETFGEGARHYFLDVLTAQNNSRYLRISRSDFDHESGGYRRSQVIVFEEDLFFLVEALTMLLGRSSAFTDKAA